MTTTQCSLYGEVRSGRTDAHEVLVELEVDYTPVPCAVQILVGLAAEVRLLTPRRILDPSAGSGCWPRAARAVFGAGEVLPFIVGVEPRASEAANIAAACDAAYTLDCAGYLEQVKAATLPARVSAPFDLIATNPPFSAFEAGFFWPLEFLRAGIIHADSWVVLYGLTQWGQSDKATPAMRAWQPSLQLRLGGRPQHRGKGNGADSREYSAWCWSARDGRERRSRLPSWRTVQLPVLDAPLRQWLPDDVPGLRPIDQALVERLRGELQ